MNNEICKSSKNIDENLEDEPLLISIKDACKVVGVGRNTMLKLAKVKGFPALILPRQNLNW